MRRVPSQSYGTLPATRDHTVLPSVRNTWKPEYAGLPHLFSLPHTAHAVVENLGTEGPHTYFSVIRLMVLPATRHE